MLKDRVFVAYYLGDLDAKYSEYCRWWGEFVGNGDLNAVLLFYMGLCLPVVLMLGEFVNVEELLVVMC